MSRVARVARVPRVPTRCRHGDRRVECVEVDVSVEGDEGAKGADTVSTP